MPADSARRRELLAAMGITLYRRRGAAAARSSAPAPGPAADTPFVPLSADAAATATIALVVVGQPADRARLALLQRLLGAAAVRWIDASPERLDESPPVASAYLVLGSALARPLGAELPTATQQAAQIVVTTAPGDWRGAAAKRAVWQALKPLRRRLRGG